MDTAHSTSAHEDDRMTLDQLLLFCAASFVLAFTPGPDIIYVLTRGVAQGRGAALAAAAGFSLGNVGHTAAAILGVSAMVAASATAFTLLKLAGAAYLVYLGLRMLRAPADALAESGDGERKAAWAVFRQSVVANMLNPKVAVFFLAFLPQFVRQDGAHPSVQMAVLGAVFIAVTFVSFGTVALCSGALSARLRARPSLAGRLNKAAGCVLMGLGLSLALSEGR